MQLRLNIYIILQADKDIEMLKRYLLTAILVYSDHPWDHKKWPLVTDGRCYEVIYVIRVSKWDLKIVVVIDRLALFGGGR